MGCWAQSPPADVAGAPPMRAGMQGGWMAAVSETYANQYGYFKLVYDYGWGAINAANAYGYKGIMFWRWDPTGNAGSGFDEAATIGMITHTLER